MPRQHRVPSHVVILGGGITGLSAAFHLARKHPTVQITLFEKSARFGGWVRSERVNVYDSDGNRGSVLLEAGPRTIRPNAKSVLQLIQLLDLRSEVTCTPRGSPAARNRFLHAPPTQGLQPLPSGLLSLFTLPLGRLVLRSVLAEPFVPANRPQKKAPQPASPPPPSPPPPSPSPPADSASQAAPTTTTTRGATEAEEEDESVDSFFSRRFGDAFARTLGSALVHGIYAADSRVLSVRAAFPVLRESEARGKGSVVWGELGPPAWFGARRKAQVKAEEEEEEEREEMEEGVDREWEAHFRASVALFSFKEGMETLVRALVEALRGFPNVTLRCGAIVRGIDTTADEDCGNGDRDHDDRRLSFQIYLDAEDGIRDKDADSDADKTTSVRATHVISAVPLPALDSILQSPAVAAAGTHATTTLPHLRANPHSSVTVLNLVFPNLQGAETKPLHPPGFGYLIPRPENGYPSSSTPGLEPEPEPGTEREGLSRSEGPGLLGVVFDTACLPEQDDDDAAAAAAATFTKLTAMLGGPYPLAHSSSDAELVAAVLPRIAAHLGRDLPPPAHYAVHRNEGSIPTYLVGHTARMEALRRAVRERWGGRMKIVGAGVGGVSVADCVQAGRHAAYEIGKQIGD